MAESARLVLPFLSGDILRLNVVALGLGSSSPCAFTFLFREENVSRVAGSLSREPATDPAVELDAFASSFSKSLAPRPFVRLLSSRRGAVIVLLFVAMIELGCSFSFTVSASEWLYVSVLDILFNNFGCGDERREELDNQIKTGERSFRDVSEEMWGSLDVRWWFPHRTAMKHF